MVEWLKRVEEAGIEEKDDIQMLILNSAQGRREFHDAICLLACDACIDHLGLTVGLATPCHIDPPKL